MKIVSLVIENWRSYYDSQIVSVSTGLNLFLGENGEGKTKLFEAFKWFLNGSEADVKTEYVNAKALKELPIGKSLDCSLMLIMKDESSPGSKTEIKKSFKVVKNNESSFTTVNASYSGIFSNNKGERFPLENSKKDLSMLFPDQTRAFSVFEGEDQLDILGQKDSLKSLISLLTDRGVVSRNLEGIDYLKRKTEKVYEDSFKHEKKLHKELSDLNFRVEQKEEEHEKLIEQLNKQNSNQSKIIEQIEGLEAILSKAKEFNTISEELKNKKQARIGIMASVKDNFTRSLFDDQWLLLGFEDILKDLEEIYSKTEKERRNLQKEFHLAQGQEIAKRSLQDDLKNGIIPFPIGVPGKDRLREMLDDEICKVCGREAHKNSEAYLYIESHYSILEKPLGPDESDPKEELFKNEFVKELNDFIVQTKYEFQNDDSIRKDIKDVLELNSSLYNRAVRLDEEIEELKNAMVAITGVSGVSETKLESVIGEYQKLSESREIGIGNIVRLEERIKLLESDIEGLRRQKEDLLKKGGPKNPNLEKAVTYSTFLKKAFSQLWESQLEKITSELEFKTNEVFSKINVDAFKGNLRLNCQVYTKGDFQIDVVHELSDGRKFKGANKSLITSANISLVMAASELVQELGYSPYPLIFDAPISSFGEKKSISFLKALKDSKGQFLLLLKDFIKQDGGDLKLTEDFNQVQADKVHWLKLKRPFNDEDLTTLQTEIIPIR